MPDPSDVVTATSFPSGGDKWGMTSSPSSKVASPPHMPTARTNINGVTGDSSRGVNVSSHSSAGDQQELYTEAYAEVETEENDAEYAVVSPTRKAVIPSPSRSVPIAKPPPPKLPSPVRNPLPVRRPTPPITSQLRHQNQSPVPVSTPSPSSIPSASNSSHPTPAPPINNIDEHEYNVTSHVQEAVCKKNAVVPPIPPPTGPRPPKPVVCAQPLVAESSPPAAPAAGVDEYSLLNHPGKKRKVTPDTVGQGLDEYSVLSNDGDKAVVPTATAQDEEEYSVLSEERVSHPVQDERYGHLDLQAVNTGSSQENHADSAVYEEVKSDSPIKSANNSKVEGATPPVQPKIDKHPRALARKASDKFKDDSGKATVLTSRDRSALPAYREDKNSVDVEAGVSRLPPRSRPPPPVPHPKRQKKMPPQQNDEAPVPTASTPDSAGNSEVPTSVLEEAGYETVNTFSPPPEEMETETNEQKPLPKPPIRKRKPRGGKPPPLPKPKQTPSPTPARNKTASSDGLAKEEHTAESQGMEYEPVNPPSRPLPVPPPATSTTEQVSGDGSHESECVPRVISPKVELDIDHIMQVGGALLNLEKTTNALYDNQPVMDAVNTTEVQGIVGSVHPSVAQEDAEVSALSEPKQQPTKPEKRGSRLRSYENKLVIDAIQGGSGEEYNNPSDDDADSRPTADGGDIGTRDPRQLYSQPGYGEEDDVDKMEVCQFNNEDSQGVMDSTSRNEDEDSCAMLSPSEYFTVPQHAVPGRLGYCDVSKIDHSDQQQGSNPPQLAVLVQNENNTIEDADGTFTVPPHSYPDPQGYCDIDIQEPPSSSSHSSSSVRVSMTSTASSRDSTTVTSTTAGAGVVDADLVTDARGYCDIDIQTPPPSPSSRGGNAGLPQGTSTGEEFPTDARGYCDIDVQSPPPRISHEYELVPETVKRTPGSNSSPGSKGPPLPSTKPKPSSTTHDKTAQEESGKTSSTVASPSNKGGVTPKRPTPRRRAPPPPPVKSKTVEEPAGNSPQLSPIRKELVISTGLATIPRSPKTSPPKPPPPFSGSSSPILSRKLSPMVTRKQDTKLSPLPPIPPPSSPTVPSTSEPSQSGGKKKKFKGLFKQKPPSNVATGDGGSSAASDNSPTSSGGLGRRLSWSKKKKGKTSNDTFLQPQDNGGDPSPKSKAKSLPGHARVNQHTQPQLLQSTFSYDADQEDEDESGIYSTVNESKDKPLPTSSKPLAAAAVLAASYDNDSVKADDQVIILV